MRIALVRHGETDWNRTGRAQGQHDIPLNDLGLQQAQLLAERLRDEQWDAIYASDLARAAETARVIAQPHRLVVQTDARLREMNKGEIEGTTEQERVQRWGERWIELPLGFETEESLMQRAASFLNDVLNKFQREHLLIVSHGVWIDVMLQTLIPDLVTTHPIPNASLTIVSNDGCGWRVELLHCVRHLLQSDGSQGG